MSSPLHCTVARHPPSTSILPTLGLICTARESSWDARSRRYSQHRGLSVEAACSDGYCADLKRRWRLSASGYPNAFAAVLEHHHLVGVGMRHRSNQCSTEKNSCYHLPDSRFHHFLKISKDQEPDVPCPLVRNDEDIAASLLSSDTFFFLKINVVYKQCPLSNIDDQSQAGLGPSLQRNV